MADEIPMTASPLSHSSWKDRVPPRQLVVHAVVLCLFGMTWMLDSPIARAMDFWYNRSGKLNGELHQVVISLAQYGQPLGILASIALMWTFDSKQRGRILLLLAVLAVAGFGSDILKSLAGRVRPIDADFQTIFQGPVRNLADTRTQAFPSGHTSTAFALSYALALLYPNIRFLVWPLAFGVGLNRVLTVRHFPTDVIAGAWFGYFSAAWVASSPRLGSLVERCNVRWAAFQLHSRGLASRVAGHQAVRRALASPWLLAAACLAMYWAGNGDYGLWDRDEPRFATATREMMARGDWIVPTFNGELRPDKPILIYWLQAAAYAVFGDGPFAARFWSGVGGTLACLTTLRLATEMFDRRVGLVAGWILALSPMLIIESKLATVDALLLACIVPMFYSLWRVHEGDNRVSTRVLFWSVLGLGVLTKGPVALVVPAVSMAAFCAIRREGAWLGRLGWKWGPALAIAIVAPWTIAVEISTGGEFLRRAIGRHVITRTLEPMENHSGFPGYYVVTLFALMAPWALLLPWAIWTHRRRLRVDPRITFLTAWAFSTLLLFEGVRTKLVHYVLPAYPAFAVLLASALVGRFQTMPMGIRVLSRKRVGWGMMALGVAFILTVAAFAMAVLPQSIGVPAGIVAAVAGLGFLIAGRFALDGHWRLAFTTQVAVGVVAMIAVGTQLVPRIHRHQAIVAVAHALRDYRQLGQSVALWRYRDPSLVYKLRDVLPIVDANVEHAPFRDCLELARRSGGFVLPLTDDQIALLRADPALSIFIRETVRQWDIAGLRERTVHIAEVRVSDAIASQPAVRPTR